MMRVLWIAVWCACAGVAVAEPYCKPDAAELAALPGQMAGDWQRAVVAGAAVLGGVPRQMPADAMAMPAALTAEGAGIGLPDPSLPETAHLLPGADADQDYALPGESPLLAQELLEPMLAEAGVACAAVDLPQFQAQIAAGQGLGMRLRLYVLGPDKAVLVTYVAQLGPVARPGTAVRVLMRYTR